MGIKQEMVESTIKKIVTEIIQFDLKDSGIGFVTVTDVKVTNDYSYAKIFVSFLGKNERQQAGLKALNRAKPYIRKCLSQKLTIRKTPELIIELDETYEKARKIDNIIKEIHKNEK